MKLVDPVFRENAFIDFLMAPAKNYITIDLPCIEVLSPGEAPFQLGQLAMVSKNGDAVKVHDMYLPNFSVRISEGKFEQDVVFVNANGEGLTTMGACLLQKGSLQSMTDPTQNGIQSFDGSQNFKYDPNNIFVHRARAHHPFRIVHFSVKPNHLFNFLPENESWSDDLKAKIESGKSVIGHNYVPITLLQDQALKNIFNCPLSGQLGQMMIETSIAQVILIQLHLMFQSGNAYLVSLDNRDVDLAHGLKEYLATNFLEDHSLDSIAKKFAINTNKLMCLFKKTFGKSIFEYLSELKMDHARQLLEQREYRISEVSRIIGYKNPNHFSVAFKKRFDINPSQLFCKSTCE